MTIKNGDKVKVEYTGTLEDGTVFDSSKRDEKSEPLEFEVGAGKIIQGFEKAIIGMEKGEEKDIKLNPEEAYGHQDSKKVMKIPKDKLPKEKEPEVGMVLIVGTPEGQQIPAKIKEVDDKEITLDLNHPLAGKILNFKVKIVDAN
tara:strand:- start:3730 stop:4164 length:435 start_codon:yes stop_codon:yes gene_type:complete